MPSSLRGPAPQPLCVSAIPANDLPTGSSRITRITAGTAAILLVSASAGFSCYYAWQTGSAHGVAVGALTVALALGLECCKPVAVAMSAHAFSQRRPGRASAMALLAAIAISYSLLSALTIIGGVRGDAVAARDAAGAAGRELAMLRAVRPPAVIEAGIAAAKLKARVRSSCDQWQPHITQRVACIETILPLEAELATAVRRAELEARPGRAVGPADPAASALSFYASAAGWTVRPEAVSQWALLVPILALEIGSALSLVLVRGVATPIANRTLPPSTADSADTVSLSVIPEPVRLLPAPTRAAVADRIVMELQAADGRLRSTSCRSLAEQLGCSKSTAAAAVNDLLASGVVARAGSGLRLTARQIPNP